MPVPKGKREIYGRILGHMINVGKSPEEAKAIAERAIRHRGVNDKSVKGKKKKGN